MKRNFIAVVAIALAAASLSNAFAADAPAAPSIEPLVIGKIKVGTALQESANREGRLNQLQRVADSMDTQFRAALFATRKFSLIAGSDLDEVMRQHKVGALQDSNDPNAAKVGMLKAAKYVVVPVIDDFQDIAETMQDDSGRPLAAARRIRLSVVVNIYNINTGEVREAPNVQVNGRIGGRTLAGSTATGDQNDVLLMKLTQEATGKAASRVVDVFFPAKIIAHTDKSVTINRGDGTAIAPGQVWDTFAVGEVLKDPDTGAILGNEEVPSGKVRITGVYPKFSKAEVIQDQGLDKGNILRLHDDTPPVPAAR